MTWPRITCTCSAALALLTTAPRALAAQTAPLPAPPPATLPAPIAAYRPPTIALVHPPAGTALPADRATLVFRFASGEADDPVDARSFAVLVDGTDRTSRFQSGITPAGAGEAWGTIADAGTSDPRGAPGPHAVSARVCSQRGACAAAEATVTIAASADPRAGGKRRRIFGLILDTTRRLIGP